MMKLGMTVVTSVVLLLRVVGTESLVVEISVVVLSFEESSVVALPSGGWTDSVVVSIDVVVDTDVVASGSDFAAPVVVGRSPEVAPSVVEVDFAEVGFLSLIPQRSRGYLFGR